MKLFIFGAGCDSWQCLAYKFLLVICLVAAADSVMAQQGSGGPQAQLFSLASTSPGRGSQQTNIVGWSAANDASISTAGSEDTIGTASAWAASNGNGSLGIKVSATDSPTSSQGISRVVAFGQAGWDDTLIFNAPGMAGRPGTWAGLLTLEGTGSASAQIPSAATGISLEADFKMPGISLGSHSLFATTNCVPDSGFNLCMVASSNAGFSGNGTWSLPFSIPIIFGQTMDLNLVWQMAVRLTVCATCSESAAFDFSHTLKLGGPTTLLDANNQVVSDYQLSSASGFNYASPLAVPEPAPAMQLLVGLILILLFGAGRTSVSGRPRAMHRAHNQPPVL
ncbi:MAG: hypothetical protein EKK47_21105 [Burkholderiales bacterium]|nr:MAG: hypothetical protein EKK47_21105 [Burkholderiales bacterium]